MRKIEEERFCFISNGNFHFTDKQELVTCSHGVMCSYLRQTNIRYYRFIQLRSFSAVSIEGIDRYLVEIISYIGERVALQTDEINWRFQ